MARYGVHHDLAKHEDATRSTYSLVLVSSGRQFRAQPYMHDRLRMNVSRWNTGSMERYIDNYIVN